MSIVQMSTKENLCVDYARMQFPFGGFRAKHSELLTMTMHTTTEIEWRLASMVAPKMQFLAWIEWSWSHIVAVTMELDEPVHRWQSHSLTHSVSVYRANRCPHSVHARRASNRISCAQMTDVCEYQFHHVCRTDARGRHDIVHIHSRSIKVRCTDAPRASHVDTPAAADIVVVTGIGEL